MPTQTQAGAAGPAASVTEVTIIPQDIPAHQTAEATAALPSTTRARLRATAARTPLLGTMALARTITLLADTVPARTVRAVST